MRLGIEVCMVRAQRGMKFESRHDLNPLKHIDSEWL
jgi:hypothetical protein